ncbi:MAG: hypothetical protein WA376_03885 [Terrimicrobiaceae bacterium]
MNSATGIGRSFPLGATIADAGVNFSLFSRTATGVELLFFDHESDARPSRVMPIDPAANRTYHYWHVFVPGAEAGQIYGYRVQDRTIHQEECGLMLPSYCSTHTVAAWLCPGTTAATPPASEARIPRRR